MRLLEFTEFKNKAIFTAGLPGSGKSTLVTKLTSDLGLPVIDVDKFYNLDLLKGKTASNYDRYSEKAEDYQYYTKEDFFSELISSGNEYVLGIF